MGGNQSDDRGATNPIFGENRLKLGTFCNNSAMPQMSLARDRYNPTWERSKAIASRVNAMGMEAILSLATWRGPIWGDARHCSNQEFEPFTWAAALSALSTHASVIPTFHVKLIRPAFVAKAAMTIDHITGGRAAINIVAGNTEIAYAQFGETMEDPVARYEHVTEFTEALKKFWIEVDEFEFEGRFERVRAGASLPKPIQKPHPPIINAGASEPGRQYIAKYADVCFTHIKPDEASREPQFSSYRKLAFDEYRRTVQVWSHGYVVVRPTEREAEDYLPWYAEEQADHPWIDSWLSKLRAGVRELRPSQALYEFAELGGRRRLSIGRDAGESCRYFDAAFARWPRRHAVDRTRAGKNARRVGLGRSAAGRAGGAAETIQNAGSSRNRGALLKIQAALGPGC